MFTINVMIRDNDFRLLTAYTSNIIPMVNDIITSRDAEDLTTYKVISRIFSMDDNAKVVICVEKFEGGVMG